MIEYIINKVPAKKAKDIDWSLIPQITLSDNATAASAEYPAYANLVYNDDAMLFRFVVYDDKVNCSMTGYNMPIYEEETVEFFFSSGGDLSKYLELEWNGIGGVFCANVINDMVGGTELEYFKDNIITDEILCKGDHWIVQGEIPKELFEGKFDGEWRFNAYRIKRRADNSMILEAYSPTFEDAFHRPLKFAKLKFNK